MRMRKTERETYRRMKSIDNVIARGNAMMEYGNMKKRVENEDLTALQLIGMWNKLKTWHEPTVNVTGLRKEIAFRYMLIRNP